MEGLWNSQNQLCVSGKHHVCLSPLFFDFYFQCLMCSCFAHSFEVLSKLYLHVCRELLPWFPIPICAVTTSITSSPTGSLCHNFTQNSLRMGLLMQENSNLEVQCSLRFRKRFWEELATLLYNCQGAGHSALPLFLCSLAKVDILKTRVFQGTTDGSARGATHSRGIRAEKNRHMTEGREECMVVISWGSCNKLPQIWWHRATETDFLTILEARNPKLM